MLEQFKYIQNVGRFRQIKGTEDTRLAPLTLVFSENGRGKTTICAILRSLSDGKPDPILERKRLDADDPARVVVQFDAAKEAAFDGAEWTSAGPRILVFDEHFVDTNVYSGLSIEPSHRQGVHELVLGTEGVRYQKRVEELTDEIAALQTTVREKERTFSHELLHGLSVEAFCSLDQLDDIDTKIEEAAQAVAVLQDTEPIRRQTGFQSFALPEIDSDGIAALLAYSLPDLDQTALKAVMAHVSSLGGDAERWISEGEVLRNGAADCPYCGQNLSGSALVQHYRAYFSGAYKEHKRSIESSRSTLRAALSGDALATFDRSLQQIRDRARFWEAYITLPTIDLDSDAIANAWTKAREELLGLLEAKARAPLETLSLSESARDALAQYAEHAERVRTNSNVLVDTNESIAAAKEQAGQGNLDAARAQLLRLKATKARSAPEADAICTEFQTAKTNKAAAEAKKEQARQALDEQRARVFGTYQTTLNQLLLRLNADFRIEELKPSDKGRRGTPSSTYAFRVNKSRVDLAPPDTPSPSFRTALSAGDRNTLALAFFFATLEGQDLRDTVVVLDDPASSLDKGRSLKTVQQIRRVVESAKQVVVLSHSEELLCRLWGSADRNNTATIQVRTCGEDESHLEPWDADAASETEHDRLFALVKDYATSYSGDPQEVAPALRILLESFFRVAFPDCFLPGEQLGHFLTRCKNQLARGAPVLSRERVNELDELREYANLFHHSTNQIGYREALATISETELEAHAKDTIALIEALRGRP